MSATNDILPFCPTDTGTNLESQSAYAADSNRTNGNQPGVASSQLNNKAIRQATYVASQLAQFMLNQTNMSIQDNNTNAQLLAQINACLQILPRNVQEITATGAFTYNLPYAFFIASGNATVGATYTDSASTVFTILATVAGATLVYASGALAPVSGGGPGTLTKTGGTGDATLTYYAFRAPIELEVELQGPGGGGGASGGSHAAGNNGSAATTFGANLSAGAGSGAADTTTSQGGAGGTATISGGLNGIAVTGKAGASGQVPGANTINLSGGDGGQSYYGGAGVSRVSTSGTNAVANSGSGGGGGAQGSANTSGGGGAGGWIRAFIPNPASQYTGVVGAKGTGGSGSQAGGDGADGRVLVIARYQ